MRTTAGSMRRMIPVTLVVVAFGARASYAQDNVDASPRKLLHDYLIKNCQKHFDERREVVAALKTPEDVRRRQEMLRTKFLESIGPMPEKTPLNAKIVGTLKGDGFRVEKVIYESRPNHHITASLYLPEGKGPFPAVLLPCGHSSNGKASDAYQRSAILLAKNGIAAMSFDPIGQGERRQLLTDDNKPGIPSMTGEHTLIGIGGWLVGQGTASYRIWDGIRSLDYLASRPEIDATKLGVTGNSGGGTMSAYLMALDDRVAVAAPSCYITSLERLFATIGPQDAEQNIVGQVAFGLEHADYFTMRAPKPTMLAAATQDFFDIKGSHTTFAEAKKLFALLGQEEKVGFHEYNDKHGLSKPRREATVSWLKRWLLNSTEPAVEEGITTFKDADLRCTRSGQVLTDFKGISSFQINARYADQAKPAREAFVKMPAERQAEIIRKTLRIPAANPTVEKVEQPAAGFVEFRTKGDMPVVGRIVSPAGTASVKDLLQKKDLGQIAIICANSGVDEKVSAEASSQAKTSGAVLELRLRGLTGKGGDDNNAMLALHLDRPLAGQRVTDLLSALSQLEGTARPKVHLVGQGTAVPAVLHAAALSKNVDSVELVGGVVSWENVVQTPKSVGQLGNVVPGVLQAYDLPHLAATLAPRPLTLRGVVDATGNPLPLAEVEAAYRVCREAYDRAGASKNFKIE